MNKIRVLVGAILLLSFLYADNTDYRSITRGLGLVYDGDTKYIRDFGHNHALLIYVEDYKNSDFHDLKTPKKDVKELNQTLRNRYGFKDIQIVENPKNYDELISVLDAFVVKLKEDDNLLVYYAGHGSIDDTTKNGYWNLSLAKKDSRVGWISLNEAVNTTLSKIKSKHVLIISDSCYSGLITRGDQSQKLDNIDPKELKYYQGLYQKVSRTALTSGGVEPVLDSSIGGKGNSIFATSFLNMLRNNNKPIFTLREKFNEVSKYVINNAKQTPEYDSIHGTGHDGGDFIFLDYGNIGSIENNTLVKDIGIKKLDECRKLSNQPSNIINSKKILEVCQQIKSTIGKGYTARAKYKLGKIKEAEKQFIKILDTLVVGSSNNNVDACNLLIYYWNTVQNNRTKAKKYSKKSCDLDNGIGCFTLGVIETDSMLRLEAFEKSCDLDTNIACFNLAEIYRSGDKRIQNNRKAREYYDKSCKLHNQTACEKLSNYTTKQ